MELCDPYITQDGYDSGLSFECEVHNVSQPVMSEENPRDQLYTISLSRFQELVAKHHANLGVTN